MKLLIILLVIFICLLIIQTILNIINGKYKRFVNALEKQIKKYKDFCFNIGKEIPTCDTKDVWEWINTQKIIGVQNAPCL